MVQAACEAGTYGTFYPIWNEVKDRLSQLTYPCCIWLPWTARGPKDEWGKFHRQQLVHLLVVSNTATNRTPTELQELVEAADDAAWQIVVAIDAQDTSEKHDMIDNVLVTTQFDESTRLESGVLLQFSIKDPGVICPPEA